MDNKQPDRSMGDTWLDNILGPQDPVQEIGPDELAVQSAGLIHPADVELEKIVSETKESDWTEKTQVVNLSGVETELPQEQFRDQEYREVFGEEDSLSQVFEPENPPAPLPQPPEEFYMDSYEDYPEPEEEEPEEEDDLPPLPKGRPAMKKGYGLLGIPHILATVVWLVLTISIGVSLGRIIWVCAADMLAFGRTEERTVSITISDTDTIDDIAQMLKAKGLIRYPGLFKVFVDIKDAEEEIGAGRSSKT